MTERAGATERVVLAALLRGLVVGGLLVLLWVSWQMLRGPRDVPALPSVRVARLVPGSFMLVDAPVLPADAHDPMKLLVLREPGGLVRGFYLPVDRGRVLVPVSDQMPGGVPCDDFAPDFVTQDMGCRQARPGFGFALRHRWSLDGRPLTPVTPALRPAHGQEIDGDWVLAPASPGR